MLDRKDYMILKREADRRKAELAWYRTGRDIEITIQARPGKLWASNLTSQITTYAEASPTAIREAVDEAMRALLQGYKRGSRGTGCMADDSCECSRCEAHDPEIQELSFVD